MKLKSKGFTLIEMLIVVVIIGILAAALIPKIRGAESRARDVARIKDVTEIGRALFLYRTDNADYPVYSGAASGLSGQLSKFISSIPVEKNPASKNYYKFVIVGSNGTCQQALGEYTYEYFTGDNFMVMGNVENISNGNIAGVLCMLQPYGTQGTHYAVFGKNRNSVLSATQVGNNFVVSNFLKAGLNGGNAYTIFYSTEITRNSTTPVRQYTQGSLSNPPDTLDFGSYGFLAPSLAAHGEVVTLVVGVGNPGNWNVLEPFSYKVP